MRIRFGKGVINLCGLFNYPITNNFTSTTTAKKN